MSFYAPLLSKEEKATGVPGSRSGTLAWPAIVIAAAAAFLIQGLLVPIDADVSWLITVSERVLAGDRLYIDILEVNPPASVWLYAPLVWLANVVGARAEAVVVAAFAAAAALSTAITLRFASRLTDAPRPLWLALAVSAVALVLPMALFAQREHAALLLAIPTLAALALIAESKPLGRSAQLLCGIAAGLVIVIKPYFLGAILLPAAWAAWQRRSIKPLAIGIAAAALVIGLYAIAILAFARPYLDYLQVISHTYAALHSAWWKVLIGPSLYPMICLGLAVLLRAPRVPSLAVGWGLGAAGFLVAALVQAKNYPNHWLPQAALALLAASAMLSLPQIARPRRALIAAGLAVVAGCEIYYWTIIPDPSVGAAIERLAPAQPKIIALSPQLTTGHPVTRNVGGTWVGSRAGLFTASGARVAGLDDALARKAYREDIESFARDVRHSTPDVVLVYKPSKAWLLREPVIVNAMRGYAPASATADTEIWLRRR